MCEKISQYMNTCLSMTCILKKMICSGKITKAIDLSLANINYFRIIQLAAQENFDLNRITTIFFRFSAA